LSDNISLKSSIYFIVCLYLHLSLACPLSVTAGLVEEFNFILTCSNV
jgi:hypothetical protein